MNKPTRDVVSGTQPAYNRQSPSLEEYKNAIEASGFLLEFRVCNTLRDHGYLIIPNSPIPHPEEHTEVIEIDIEASHMDLVPAAVFSQTGSTLLIECKLNSQPIAFFSHPQDYPESSAHLVAYCADPLSDSEYLLEFMDVEKWHHYARSASVATQFCSFKKDSRITTDPCSTYRESMNRLCLATAARAFRLKDRSPEDHDPRFGFRIELVYPILVAGGPIMSVTTDADGVTLSNREHIQLHRGCRVGGTQHAFQIDVVTEPALPTLLATIKTETEVLAEWAKRHRKDLLPRAADAKRAQGRKPRKSAKREPKALKRGKT